ncbi:alcohol acetyltransferase [Thiospirochaeta perfilievii]|uniref:Alcohol acetyltransferase n=1 Tax=Thiospirochaeta perfilievii TaxID=252967 RepID=A0A5C1QA26_9SPIO|nr:alcohol acetyltransferase [Thiospirochaeta perfilievii]QEN04331.1 alcohol acetyltransferase [Thiospirochaeta perfilievii]
MNSLNNWYKLDNVAKLFPAVTTGRNSSTFRVSIILKREIKPDLLQNALDLVITRFPMFAVRIRRGLFWYFLESNDEKLLIQEEEDTPCGKIDKFKNNEYQIRVLYYNKKISIECFHSITDGVGALELLKLLALEYLKLDGNKIDNSGETLSIHDEASPYETEDSFRTYFKNKKGEKIKVRPAYKLKGSNFNNFGNNVVKGIINISELKEVCNRDGVTITQYIISLFIYSIFLEQSKSGDFKKDINIVVPVNLRSFFPSRTLRNFFSVIPITITPKEGMELKDIEKEVVAQFKVKINSRVLDNDISANFRSEKLLLIRVAPLFIKNLILRIAFNRGTKNQTASVSNLGVVNLPKGMDPHVDHVEAVLYSSRENRINCAICSFNNRLSITFSRTILEPSIIKDFFTHLSQREGLEVSIFSNHWDVNYE